MANTFSNTQLTLTSTEQNVLVAAASTTVVVFDTYISNNHTNENCLVTLKLTTSGKTTTLLNNISIPVGSSLNLPKMVLKTGDIIRGSVNSQTSNNVDITLMTLVQT